MKPNKAVLIIPFCLSVVIGSGIWRLKTDHLLNGIDAFMLGAGHGVFGLMVLVLGLMLNFLLWGLVDRTSLFIKKTEKPKTDWERVAKVQNAKLMALTGDKAGFDQLKAVMDQYSDTCWIKTSDRLPDKGELIVKRWKHNGAVWAGVYSGQTKEGSFDEWFPLP